MTSSPERSLGRLPMALSGLASVLLLSGFAALLLEDRNRGIGLVVGAILALVAHEFAFRHDLRQRAKTQD